MGKTYQSTTVNASIDDVWDALSNFHDMSWAPDVIESCEAVGDRAGNQVGAQRVLNGAFHETLHAINNIDHTLHYSIDDGPSPVSADEVSGYVGQVRALPITDEQKTFVEWSSSWEARTDEAEEFCHNIYTALLSSLKQHFTETARV